MRNRVAIGLEQSRRQFVSGMVKLMCGGLTHFAVVGRAFAETSSNDSNDECPGGIEPLDMCKPSEGNEDKCPGETAPADECPPDGNRSEDVCNSGLSAADVCDPEVRSSDQCPSSLPDDDACSPTGTPTDDFCPSGHPDRDYCPTGGSAEAGDSCPGGGDELDDCSDGGEGDLCSKGTWGDEDDCHAKEPDNCASFPLVADDDSCPNGKNVGYSLSANGLDDWCVGDWRASDECTTGTDEDDLCISAENANGAFDVCPGGRSEVDRCDDASDDYCVTGIEGSDECPDGLPANDECAGGLSSEDTCYKGVVGADECIPGNSGSDQSSCFISSLDECFLIDKCRADPNADTVE